MTADHGTTQHGTAPTVSTIIATRDRPQLLRKAIDAVLAQDYDGAIEIIVVFDQAAPDPGLEQRSHGKRTVRVITNTRTPGLAGARNSGVECARGELIAFCDDDDTWLPHKLTRQVALLARRPDVGVVMSGMVINYGKHSIERVSKASELRLEDLLNSRVQDAHPSTLLARRSAVERIGPVDEDIPGSYGEDHDWMIRAARLAPIALVPEPLIRVLWHPQSFFADRWRTIIDAIDYLLRKHPDLALHPRGVAALNGRKSFAFAALGEYRQARTWAARSLRGNPRDKRALVGLACSLRLVTPRKAQSMANRFGRGI